VTSAESVRRHRGPDATREALLLAGTELFALRGFDGVSIDDIATKAGANKALISYHFRGKRGLYRTILQSTLAACVERQRALAESPRPPADLLCEFIANFHHMATVERPFFPALMLREVLESGKTFDDDIVPEVLALFQIVRAIIARGVAEGVFRPVHPFLAHLGIVGSLLFFYATEPPRRRLVAEGRLPVPLPSTDEFLQHIQEMVIRGLAADGSHVDAGTEDTGEHK
jgi:TetR/AcrR family transcriptional regulator